MRIFLDSRDLIGLLDRAHPFQVEHLNTLLRSRSAVIAISSAVVFELAAPLVRGSGKTVVSKRLNQLEELPLSYLKDGTLRAIEIREAMQAFDEGRPYQDVNPTTFRLDAALDISGGRMGTLMYLNFPLAEIVLTIWQEAPEVLRERLDLERRFRAMLASDRALPAHPTLAEHFRAKLRRDLASYGIPEPDCGVNGLADWIYADPKRCPGTRLSYEVYHAIRSNTGDRGFVQDFGDFSHLDCLPYVDFATLDRRMADYVGRVSRALGINYGLRVRANLQAVLPDLEAAGAAEHPCGTIAQVNNK